jgi:threonine aldolase
MRQAGFLAAAASFALDHHVDRLKIDHAHAGILAAELEKCNWVSGVVPVETNIVLFDTIQPAETVISKLVEKGIKCNSTDKHRVRFVTHLDVHPDQIEYTASVIRSL